MKFDDRDFGHNPTWTWYYGMMLNVAINIAFVVYALRSNKKDKGTAVQKYQKQMRMLAIPFVFECAWRSFFPSVYNSRMVFWDTPLNSIMIDRTLACIGELCWIFQICIAMRFVNM